LSDYLGAFPKNTPIIRSATEDCQMTTYREYQQQIQKLQREAEAARREELGSAIRDIKRKIAEFNLTAADLGLEAAPAKGRRGRKAVASAEVPAAAKPGRARKARKAASTGKKVAPKYKGPNGETWTGRGRQPGWVVAALGAGRTLDEMRIL
jgi:DNA-binding protein H-NS